MENIWKYFKKGDIVRNESIWGDKLFEVEKLCGNSYSPEMIVYFFGKPKTTENMCNFSIRDSKLITSVKRPLKNLKPNIIIKLMKSGNVEAKREFIIRKRK